PITFCNQFRVISFHSPCRAAPQNGTFRTESSWKACMQLPRARQARRSRPSYLVRTGVRVVIVCSCNVISDRQVRSVTAEQAVRATSEIYRCLGCTAACGRCARTIRNIMDEVHAEMEVGAERAIALSATLSICAEPTTACPALGPVLIAAE